MDTIFQTEKWLLSLKLDILPEGKQVHLRQASETYV